MTEEGDGEKVEGSGTPESALKGEEGGKDPSPPEELPESKDAIAHERRELELDRRQFQLEQREAEISKKEAEQEDGEHVESLHATEGGEEGKEEEGEQGEGEKEQKPEYIERKYRRGLRWRTERTPVQK